jgi:hypothetical protein
MVKLGKKNLNQGKNEMEILENLIFIRKIMKIYLIFYRNLVYESFSFLIFVPNINLT